VLRDADPREVRELVERHLDDVESGWSMGAPGAIAEFVRVADEPAQRRPGTVVTERGGIRLLPPPDCRPLAYETPVGPHDRWNHAVAFCLPESAARRHAHTVITELGPDPDPLRDRDRAGVLFDLGLGTPTVDVCVRSSDPALIGELRAACGSALFGATPGLVGRLVAAGPHRVFLTACGRVEVYAAIPPPDGRSPDGPHTHLLPEIMRAGRTHPATVPIPDGFAPCAHLYPPHPFADGTGRARPFDPSRVAAFAQLLNRYGDPGQAHIGAQVAAAVRAGAGPDAVPAPTDPPGRAARAVALRKLARSGGSPETLSAWRRPDSRPDDVLDPDGDRNAG
jgi:hypothetical protein